MSTAFDSENLADLVDQLGGVDLQRIRIHPAPGVATAGDVESIRSRECRLFELVDGVLVEKVMGFRESLIALALASLLRTFVAEKNLGLVVGADGMMQLFRGTVRIPDVAFIAWDQMPGRKVPTAPVPKIAPSLAIEVLSAGNTTAEMARKRDEYFRAGAQAVWEIDIDRRFVTVYDSPSSSQTLSQQDKLSCESLLPGFELRLADLFAELDRTPDE